MDERRMVETLERQLSPRYQRILTHQNLSNNSIFREALTSRFGYVPVLNEVDMVLVDRKGRLFAIEIKCFTINGGFNRPFYDGIGQSLSLLRYGFDSVALWHLFPSDIDQKRFDRYGAATWWFIRNQLRLPLDFTYFKVENDRVDPQFIVMQYESPHSGVALLPIDSSRFVVTWKHPNPFTGEEEVKSLRAALVPALGLGDIVN